MRVRLLLSIALACQIIISPSVHPAETPTSNPAALLARAKSVMGFDRASNRILHDRADAAVLQDYQSDRTYPPFFSAMEQQEIWFDPANGVLRTETHITYPGSPATPPTVMLDDGKNAYMLRQDQAVAISRRQAVNRDLYPWAVINDWSASKDVKIAGTEQYRDYPRLVLTRHTDQGNEKLLIDPKTGFPVKLEFTEPHYLWGQRRIEYVWSNWTLSGDLVLPGSAFRVTDGEVEISQTVGVADLLEVSRAPDMKAPTAPATNLPDLPRFLQPIPPKPIPVAAHTWILSNPGYNEVLTLAGDQVFLFDATQGEKRAELDAEQIKRLIPGEHKMNVVVTDLAWPHVAGVRYWVSRGATIISHEAGLKFLRQVIDRRWTLAPDQLEVKRRRDGKPPKIDFVPISGSADFAKGAIRLIPIDGIGSEVALMVYLPGDRFLWGSDYIQTVGEPSLYAREVIAAAQRNGVTPERAAAEHLPLTEWKIVVQAQSR